MPDTDLRYVVIEKWVIILVLDSLYTSTTGKTQPEREIKL